MLWKKDFFPPIERQCVASTGKAHSTEDGDMTLTASCVTEWAQAHVYFIHLQLYPSLIPIAISSIVSLFLFHIDFFLFFFPLFPLSISLDFILLRPIHSLSPSQKKEKKRKLLCSSQQPTEISLHPCLTTPPPPSPPIPNLSQSTGWKASRFVRVTTNILGGRQMTQLIPCLF